MDAKAELSLDRPAAIQNQANLRGGAELKQAKRYRLAPSWRSVIPREG
jgi:hypothetical protein